MNLVPFDSKRLSAQPLDPVSLNRVPDFFGNSDSYSALLCVSLFVSDDEIPVFQFFSGLDESDKVGSFSDSVLL